MSGEQRTIETVAVKRFLSLGAGVQSSRIALGIERGEILPVEAAIFADTGDEPKSVYEWLDWLEKQLSYPVVRVSTGSLSLAAKAVRVSKKGGYLKPTLPVFFDRNGKWGKGARHCTLDYKIAPILRAITNMRGSAQVEQYLGISTDEADRTTTVPPKPFIRNVYPLIERNESRADCYAWMAAHGYPKPPRSACRYCPFHGDDEWIRLKTEEPKEFAAAVQFERDYQKSASKTRLDGTPYLHDSRQPLDTVIFVPGKGANKFSNECKGLCGV